MTNPHSGKAINLNADKLDGNDSAAFQRANAAAGGDLSGTYPNPQIAQNALGSSEIGNGSLRAGDIVVTVSTQTINLGNMPAGSCFKPQDADNSLNVGDLPILIAPTEIPDGLDAVAQRVITNDLLPMRMCNRSAAAIDPPALTFDIVVLRP